MKGSGMPQMRAAFAGWTQRITLNRRLQTVDDDGLVVTKDVPWTFRGTVQPLSPKEIALKPEGQRAWEWLQIHCLSQTTMLQPNDRVIYRSRAFKLMGQNDYSLNGFVEYHLVFDYVGS